jgi:hypothetical protein
MGAAPADSPSEGAETEASLSGLASSRVVSGGEVATSLMGKGGSTWGGCSGSASSPVENNSRKWESTAKRG